MKRFIKENLWLSSMGLALLIAYTVAVISIYFFGEYGWTVFTLVPFLLGLIPALLYGRHAPMSRWKAFTLGLQAILIFYLSTLLFALEGIICIVMASPIMILCSGLGSLIGHYLVSRNKNDSISYSLLLLPALFISTDVMLDTEEFLEVKTAIEIDAPIDVVWDNVISFGTIDPPREWLFQTGISYPTDAQIVGSGVGAIRYCNFTTGSFVEPITTWEEPTLLQFSVQDQPTPMRELNPFWEVHPPHLNGYFQSKKGQFQLTDLGNGRTRVEGTTWYNIHIHPVKYWDYWSKYILHQIHYRVLQHIKVESE